MGIFFHIIAAFIMSVMDWVGYILIGYIILGLVIFFGIIKNSDNVLLRIYTFLMIKIEPLLATIRNFVPPVFGLDLSAAVVLFALYLAKLVIIQIVLILE